MTKQSLTFLESIQSCDKILAMQDQFNPAEFPKVSIIIPTKNDAQLISGTIESILNQNYPSYEIIIVDTSTDRTVETVKSFQNDNIKVFSIPKSRRYEMLNFGISKSTGEYVNFLFPGDFYIFKETLKYMMLLAMQNQLPELVYCGTLLRDAKSDVKILYRKFNQELLQKGQQPTSLQSSWFKRNCVVELGKFNPVYNLRGGFDLMCRFLTRDEYRIASSSRVLIDYDLRAVTRKMVVVHFMETFRTVYLYFGLIAAFRWLIYQHEIKRFMKLWMHSLKIAFYGR